MWVVNSQAENTSRQSNSDLPHVVLEQGSNFVKDAKTADNKQVPILVMFSMNHCPYCVEVEEDYLKPMLRNKEYEDKVIIRKVRLDGTDDMINFAGKEIDPNDFSDAYSVSMVPTIVLVDANGKQLAPSIIGITNAHYYSDELDKSIDKSLQRIRDVAKR